MNQTERHQHWERVYTERNPNSVSWFQPHPRTSLELVEKAELNSNSSLIDVGGGASYLVDALLEHGVKLTVLDISNLALRHSQERLGTRSSEVNWIVADITKTVLPKHYFDLWHDRAVFHFLIDPEDRRIYLQALRWALKPGGYLVLATFAPNGPSKCSGLAVARYDTTTMLEVLGDEFRLLEERHETHLTPTGGEQQFVFGLFQFQPSGLR